MSTREFVVGGDRDFEQVFEELILKIRETDEKRRLVASLISHLKHRALPSPKLIEPPLVHPVNKLEKIEAKVAAVDSGFLSESLHSLDLMMIKGVGVIYNYNGHTYLEDVEYYPSPLPSAKLLYSTEPLDSFESESLLSIERMLIEINLALEIVEKYGPDYLLLDGSIQPRYLPRPFGYLENKISILLRRYRELYTVCEERGVNLVGVVKDCRSNHFIRTLLEILSDVNIKLPQELREFVRHLRDTVLLDCLLLPGERSCVFRCSDELPLFSFYIKTVPNDRPLRIEYLGGTGAADKIAEVIFAISAHHPEYAVPAPLVVADMCAHLSREELQLVKQDLLHQVGLGSLIDLRRDKRPF